MSKNDIWYGFLQAGKKSSPVVRDSRLKTKNPKTIYLFNYTQGKFLEYSREIVEPKLQELRSDDNFLNELKIAFKTARKIFVADRSTHKRAITIAISNIKTAGLSDVDDIPDMIPEDTIDLLHEDDYVN
ncbi:MAG: hypothetical protein WBN51_12065 [Gammaproteobacteria bacterium]